MGITISEASPERVVGSMPVAGNTQLMGLLHGGASCVLAETLGSVGAQLYAQRLFGGAGLGGAGVDGEGVDGAGVGGQALGVDINATHHRAVRDGTVIGVATPLRLGRSVASYEIVISTESGARVCTARLTCLLRQP